ncbi:thioredoxin [Artemisia annua]|uniref:Thioredoxin n=1 Tax=Artemisia annua TaxID=35608 RepID=A0A2U1KZT3_ARTAN|nr:thioredoxin [Artemisia annua]
MKLRMLRYCLSCRSHSPPLTLLGFSSTSAAVSLPSLGTVLDEYDEQSEIAERLRIKLYTASVPLVHFYRKRCTMEAFVTRDKVRIKEAIEKYTACAPAAAQNA